MIQEIINLADKTITLGRNEFISVKGHIDTNLYFIESGSVKVYVLGDCEEQII